MNSRIGRSVALLAVAAVALAAPLVVSDLTFLVNMVLAAIVVTGLSLLMGLPGSMKARRRVLH